MQNHANKCRIHAFGRGEAAAESMEMQLLPFLCMVVHVGARMCVHPDRFEYDEACLGNAHRKSNANFPGKKNIHHHRRATEQNVFSAGFCPAAGVYHFLAFAKDSIYTSRRTEGTAAGVYPIPLRKARKLYTSAAGQKLGEIYVCSVARRWWYFPG